MIEKTITTTNGAVIGFHCVQRVEAGTPMNVLVVRVNSYANEEAYLAGMNVLFSDVHTVPATNINGSLLDHIENHLVTDGESAFKGGLIVHDKSDSIETLRARKSAEITRSRITADADRFVYEGKEIRTADKDMIDLLTTNSYVTLFGAFDEDWPGGWKAIDNSYVAISTVNEWKPFFKAMYKKGIANFRHSQQLKSLIAAAETPEELAAIYWGMPNVQS